MNRIEIFTSLDLEMNQPSGTIISLGAVVGNIDTGEILEKLSVIVNPKEQLSEFIIGLTGITQDQVNNGVTLEEAYLTLKAMHQKYNSFRNPITWGGGDSKEILDQLGMDQEDENWCFGRRWIDAKTLFVSWRFANGLSIQGGLKNACNKIGVKFQGPAHRADLDALNTFHAYRVMLQKLLKDKNGQVSKNP